MATDDWVSPIVPDERSATREGERRGRDSIFNRTASPFYLSRRLMGKLLSVAESLAVTRGRELTRRSLETVLQEEIAGVNKKDACAKMSVRRARCTSRLPIASDLDGGGLGQAAARVLCLPSMSPGPAWRGPAGGHHGRANASGRADAVLGRGQLVICQRQPVFAPAERIVRVGQQCATGLPTGKPRIEAWQATPAAAEQYRQTPGQDEFQTDGTCVNTDHGWKEMRVGVFAKRLPGAAAAPQQWATRRLPPPAARVAFAAIEDHQTFAARWPVVASRLGIRAAPPGCLGRWRALDLGACRFSLCLRPGHAGYLSCAGTCRRCRPGLLAQGRRRRRVGTSGRGRHCWPKATQASSG